MSSNGVYGEAGQQLLQRDLELAVSIIPVELREKVWEHEEHMDLVELVLDYGRKPLARFPSGDFILSERLVTDEDLADAVASASCINALKVTTTALVGGSLWRFE